MPSEVADTDRPSSIHIREERRTDAAGIRDAVSKAFGRDDEAMLVEALRAGGFAMISLVAEERGRIVGHVALSVMEAPFAALALAPVSVIPERQGRGIGSLLVREAIVKAANHWKGIFVLGDPAFYTRFGFDANLASTFASPYAGAHFMVLALDGTLPASDGAIRHAPPFAALG